MSRHGRSAPDSNEYCLLSHKDDGHIGIKGDLRGGLDKMKEAGVTLAGGHSVEDSELMRLSVTGIIHPSRVLTNVGAEPGDKLVLTKPLGTGIINTAIKAGMVDEGLAEKVTRSMARLNDQQQK